MDIHPEDVIISLINIAVLFVLLRLILWKHIIRFLNERASRINNDTEQAEKHRIEAKALRESYKEKLADVEEQGLELIRESRRKADEESERILKDARSQVSAMIRDAETRIEADKEQALLEAHLEVTQLATDMAARILERRVSASDNQNAVEDFFRE